MSVVTPRTLPGFMQLLPKEQILFNEIKEKIQKSYEKFGFLPIDTPVIELSEVLLAKAGGETEKQIYKFNKGNRELALRFDLTVPLAKYVTENYNDLTFPFRRYQIGKVYRGERQQKGRYREFYQCDIDIIGDGELSNINDAEIPSVIYNTFKELNFGKFTICINNRKILNGLFESLELTDKSADILRIIDKIEKIGKNNVIAEMKEIQITEEKINKIMEFISIEGTTEEKLEKLNNLNIISDKFQEGIKDLTEVVKYIKAFGVPADYFKIDLTIARGLDYYTGTVYETFLDQYKELGSVCSGGRYDDLAGYYTTKKLPGVGISIGLTRLFYQLNENKIIEATKKSIADVIIVSMVDDYSYAANVATAFREAGINTQLYTENKKVKAKFKYADKLEIPYVAVIGEDEISDNTIMLKDMKKGKQQEVKVEEAIKIINYSARTLKYETEL